MAILVLEGVNATGKSTLARQLGEDLQWSVLKFSVPTEEAFPYFREGLNNMDEMTGPDFIVDRCHLSNHAYGNLQGGTVLYPDEWYAIDQWLADREAWLFLMTDDVFAIEQRLRERDGDGGLTRPQLATLQRRFEDLFDQSDIQIKGQYSLNQFLRQGEKTEQYCQLVQRLRRGSV